MACSFGDDIIACSFGDDIMACSFGDDIMACSFGDVIITNSFGDDRFLRFANLCQSWPVLGSEVDGDQLCVTTAMYRRA